MKNMKLASVAFLLLSVVGPASALADCSDYYNRVWDCFANRGCAIYYGKPYCPSSLTPNSLKTQKDPVSTPAVPNEGQEGSNEINLTK